MREIKFRIPHYDFQGNFKCFTYWGKLDDDAFTAPSTVTGALIKKQDEQYTSLKDKNGKEIYEGDISQYGYVILYNAWKGLFAEHNKLGAIMSYPMDASQVMIIGNIHENPELLNG